MGNMLFGCALVLRTRYGNEAKPTLEGNEFVMSSPPQKKGGGGFGLSSRFKRDSLAQLSQCISSLLWAKFP